MEEHEIFERLVPESRGQNLALTVLHVPSSPNTRDRASISSRNMTEYVQVCADNRTYDSRGGAGVQAVEIESTRKQLVRAADTGYNKQHNA